MLVKLQDLTSKDVISGVYKINYPNGKYYIGQAQNIRSRILEHNQRAKNTKSTRIIQNCDLALRKMNYEISEFEILEIVKNLEELDNREKYWINYYNSLNKNKGYNLLDHGNVSGRRGIDNTNASFNQEQLNDIIDLLLNHTELSLIDIANKYGVTQNTILRISTGKSYINSNLQYPLRRNNHDAQKKQLKDYFDNIEILFNLKEDLKYSWWLSIEYDLPKIYNIPLNVIRDINNGHKYSEYGDYEYPIRNKNVRNIYNFTKEDILNILNLLKNTKLTMTDIGNQYNISRSTISKINNGQTYIIKDYNYPARIT